MTATAPRTRRDDVATPVRSRKGGRAARLVQVSVVPVALLLLWWALSTWGGVRPIFLPSPARVWHSFVSLLPRLPGDIAVTVSMTLTGFGIGAAIGIATGLLLAYSSLVRRLFGGVIDAFRPIPIFALIPLFILWFGLGKTPQVVLVGFGTFVVLVVTTLEAIRNVSPTHVKAALNLGASRSFMYRTVIVPSITPHLAGAVRVAAGASWGLGVAAEFIGAQSGLGYLMINRQNYIDTAGILVVVIVYSVIAFLFDLLIRVVQRRVVRWSESDQGSAQVGSALGG